MAQNKILRKMFLPRNLLVGSFLLVSLSTISSFARQDIKNNKQIETADSFLLSLTVLAIILWTFAELRDYKQLNKSSVAVVRKYLKDTMKEQPEWKLFEKNLSNPKAMKSVATVISNSLRPSEQKRIIDIISNIKCEMRKCKEYDLEEREMASIFKKMFVDAREEIIKIVKEHASVHPEFIRDVYIAMAYADMTYVIPNKIQQHTR